MDLLNGGGLDTSTGTQCHRRKHRQKDQKNLGQLINTKPNDHQGQVSQWWNGSVKLNRRIKNSTCDGAHAHRDAKRNPYDTGQQERTKNPQGADPGVFPKAGTGKAVSEHRQKSVDDAHRGRQEKWLDESDVSDQPPDEDQANNNDCTYF